MILLQILVCILIVDFLSGFFHWLEDSYGQENWLLIGDFVTKPNIIHHHNPRHFVYASWWVRNRVLFFMAGNALAIAHLLHFLNWQIFLIISIGTSANEIHRWAHQTTKESGGLIYFLQKSGIVQSPFHHALHHQGLKNTHYCVITNWLNPLLEVVNLWRLLEIIVAKVFGTYPRPEQSICLSEVQP